jgi:hypothetical protein
MVVRERDAARGIRAQQDPDRRVQGGCRVIRFGTTARRQRTAETFGAAVPARMRSAQA